jgi:hypothetical protein
LPNPNIEIPDPVRRYVWIPERATKPSFLETGVGKLTGNSETELVLLFYDVVAD